MLGTVAVVFAAFVVLNYYHRIFYKKERKRCLELCERSGEGIDVLGGCFHLCPERSEYFENKYGK